MPPRESFYRLRGPAGPDLYYSGLFAPGPAAVDFARFAAVFGHLTGFGAAAVVADFAAAVAVSVTVIAGFENSCFVAIDSAGFAGSVVAAAAVAAVVSATLPAFSISHPMGKPAGRTPLFSARRECYWKYSIAPRC